MRALAEAGAEPFRALLPVGYQAGIEAYRRAVAGLAVTDLTQHYTTGLDVPNLVESKPPSETSGLAFNYIDWLAKAPEHEIARVIRDFGEERFAKRIARAIVHERSQRSIARTLQLAEIVAGAVPMREPGKHPATRTFQAVRIQVNQEFQEIDAALEGSLQALAPEGRLCAISFHSLEDGIVKRFIQKHSQEDPVYAGLPMVPQHAQPKLRRVGKAVHPTAAEVANNPRARSAIMRVAARVAA